MKILLINYAYFEIGGKVTVLDGDGALWWAGGMKKGMEFAYQQGADYIIWFNDDCRPQNAEALRTLLDYSVRAQCISVGQAKCPSGMVYGGAKKTFFGRASVDCPVGTLASCDTFAGNAVCIPRFVVEKIGYPDAENFPMMGDADYGFRATKNEIPAVVIGDALFENEDNLNVEHESFLLSSKTTRELLLATFGSVKSFYYFPSFSAMAFRHYGVIRGGCIIGGTLFKYGMYIGARVLLPRSVRIVWFGRHLRAWNVQSHYEAKKRMRE